MGFIVYLEQLEVQDTDYVRLYCIFQSVKTTLNMQDVVLI